MLGLQVSIQACTEGIIPVSQKTKTLDPRQQDVYVFEVSSSLNIDFEHNCTGKLFLHVYIHSLFKLMKNTHPVTIVMLFDNDGNILDSKTVAFKTMEGCIYCPDGVCECEVSAR